MVAPPTDVISFVMSVLQLYVLPFIPTLIVVLAAVGLASWMSGRRKAGGQRKALREELAMNVLRGTDILAFVDSQKTGEMYITPIPRFRRSAFDDLLRAGNLSTLRRGIREELLTVYAAIERIDEASDRQEELLAGVPGASPVAADLRAENLRFIRDTVANIVLPRLEQFGTFTRRAD